jgi:HAD superfamily hydrolase (TIGR01549 family)
MRTRAVLLDMGGVLVPEPPGYQGAVRDQALIRFLREQGIADPAQVVTKRGEQLRDAYRALEAECAQPDPDVVFADIETPIRSRLLDAFKREAIRPAYPGARDIVADLARAYKLGLVSNTVIPGDHHARNLEAAGILEHLSSAVWSANFGKRKPDPAMIFHVLDELGVALEDAVFVGDKIRTDVLAARRAGLPVIWLRRPDTPHTGEAEPDFIIQDLRELPGLLRDHFPASLDAKLCPQ